MAQTSMTLRVDNSLKKNFDNLCEEFGFTTTAAITVFMKTVVRERKIPFEIKASSKDEINAKGWEAILKMGKQAEDTKNCKRSLTKKSSNCHLDFASEKTK